MQTDNENLRGDRFVPAQLWQYVVGTQAAGIHINPKRLTSMILGGRMQPYTVDILITVVETSKIINKITGKDPHHGA